MMLLQTIGDSFGASCNPRKESGFSAALFLTPPKLNAQYHLAEGTKTQKDEQQNDQTLVSEESSFANQRSISKIISLVARSQAGTVSNDDLLVETSCHKTAPQFLSKELMRLIDSGGSSSPRAVQDAKVCDFEAVSNFESGFQQRLSRLERTRSSQFCVDTFAQQQYQSIFQPS